MFSSNKNDNQTKKNNKCAVIINDNCYSTQNITLYKCTNTKTKKNGNNKRQEREKNGQTCTKIHQIFQTEKWNKIKNM